MSKRKPDPPEFDGKAAAAALPLAPGVYRMLNADDGVLYVGKARASRSPSPAAKPTRCCWKTS